MRSSKSDRLILGNSQNEAESCPKTTPMNLSAWFLAARPKTLLASVSPVAIGTALAAHEGKFHALAMLCALVGAISIQIGTNFCNDYFDFFQGADTSDRKGPTRAVATGLISPRALSLIHI